MPLLSVRSRRWIVPLAALILSGGAAAGRAASGAERAENGERGETKKKR